MADIILRAEVTAAVLDAIGRVGLASFRADGVVKAFLDRGSSKATLYRWIEHVLKFDQASAVPPAASSAGKAQRAAPGTPDRAVSHATDKGETIESLPPDLVLKREFEAAVLEEIARVGLSAFDKSAMVKLFAHRAGRSTLYRMVDLLLKSGRAGQQLASKVKALAGARAHTSIDPAASAAFEAAASIPGVVSVMDLSVATGNPIDVMMKLRTCVDVADDLIRHARTDDGKVRNAKMLLGASEHLRRCMATAAQLQEAMLEVAHIERFHAAIFDVLREESPVLVERVLVRIKQLNRQWGVEV